MPATYESIATSTASGSTSTVTFSSIPSTYTDLVVIVQYQGTANSGVWLQYNNDTGTNYSITNLIGSFGGATVSYANPNQPYVWADTYYQGTGTVLTDRAIAKAHIMNYSNTTTFKSTLCRSDDVRTTAADAGTVYLGVSLWRNTSAITRVDVLSGGGNFVAGSTFTLYGIKAA
jgi:hypothetical protein